MNPPALRVDRVGLSDAGPVKPSQQPGNAGTQGLVQWPELTRQDIQAALLYGARSTNYEWIALHEE